jgi:hypothetical protein
MAVVQVLEMKPLATTQTTATAARIRPGRSPTQGRPKTPKASRLSSPWRRIASAKRNDPINRKISGSAKGAKTSRAGATPATTQATAPARAVTASGSASVIQRITTATTITAKAWASGESSIRVSLPEALHGAAGFQLCGPPRSRGFVTRGPRDLAKRNRRHRKRVVNWPAG